MTLHIYVGMHDYYIMHVCVMCIYIYIYAHVYACMTYTVCIMCMYIYICVCVCVSNISTQTHTHNITIVSIYTCVVEALGASAALNPYSEEYMYRTKSKAASNDALSDAVSTATASSEYEARYKAMQDILKDKDAQIEKLIKELADAKEMIRKGVAAASADAVETIEDSAAELAPVATVTSAAAKQRLRRMCERRADGGLQVTQEIHDQWKAGGASRERLLKIWVGSGFDKDSFIHMVTHETRKSKELKISVTGDFYSEEEMKDELQLSKSPVLHESGFFLEVDARMPF